MKPYRAALAERLAAQGFVEGRNLELDARSATEIFRDDRTTVLDILKRKTDALFTCATRPTEAAKAATKTVPIVFAWVPDPVVSGIVPNLARPGANVTGTTTRFAQLMAKRLELALELRPGTKRIAVIIHGYQINVYQAIVDAHLRPAAMAHGVELLVITTRTACCTLDAMFDAAVKEGAEAVLPMITYALSPLSGAQLIERSLATRVATIFSDIAAVEHGGLASYGTNLVDDVRRGAEQLTRVLKGESASKLAVDQADRFELAVNLKTALAIGLQVPPSILLRADRGIE